jgi:putative acetyltransferase
VGEPATGANDARCPRCGGQFHCGATDPARCACTNVALPALTLERLRDRYAGCLCLVCLRDVQRSAALACPPDSSPMDIRLDDLSGPEIRALLEEHLRNMHALSPPESVHALDLAALRQPGISFWTVWSGEQILGCGALKELAPSHAEVKSMRTAAEHRRKGVAKAVLSHLIQEARARGYARLSLETGSQPGFEPARSLYAAFGFEYCGPFGDYVEDPHSVFMTKCLVGVPLLPGRRGAGPVTTALVNQLRDELP